MVKVDEKNVTPSRKPRMKEEKLSNSVLDKAFSILSDKQDQYTNILCVKKEGILPL